MKRKEMTEFLGNLLIQERLSGMGKYWANEVSIDYGTTDVKRVDFMQFEPPKQMSISDLEKGIFTCYEIKSCKADFNSGFGKNFIGEKNYFVMPMRTYKEVIQEIPHSVGVLVPIPRICADKYMEFENPTEIDGDIYKWKLWAIRTPIQTGRKRSMVELLFCMLRSGKTELREPAYFEKQRKRMIVDLENEMKKLTKDPDDVFASEPYYRDGVYDMHDAAYEIIKKGGSDEKDTDKRCSEV